MNRNRGTASIPEELQTNERFSTKKQLAAKEQYRPCPALPPKPRKMAGKEVNLKPTAISFCSQATLSPVYDSSMNASYFDQVFIKNGYLGEGSFGKVYRVRSREDQQIYAVKRIKANVSAKDRYAEVNNNEIVGVHPNFVQYFMAWEENNEMFMLLEYCDMSLADYSTRNNNIPEEMLYNVLYDMCKALECLHNKNLLHLDVKPGNIMLKNGFYKLGDFGLLVDMKSDNRVSKSTLSDGDSKYLALEVLDGVYTPACDIFGLGLTLLELSTDLELPDHGPLWHRLRHNILPNELYERVSLGLRIIILKMTSSNYKFRPTAEKILSFSTVRAVEKRDGKLSRTDFAAPYMNGDELHTVLHLSPISLNNNNNNNTQTTLTPPYRYSSDYESNIAMTSKEGGRKSLFQSDKNGFRVFEDSPSSVMTSGVQSLNDSGMDIDENNFNSCCVNSMVTSTPVLKSRQSRKLPRAQLNFH